MAVNGVMGNLFDPGTMMATPTEGLRENMERLNSAAESTVVASLQQAPNDPNNTASGTNNAANAVDAGSAMAPVSQNGGANNGGSATDGGAGNSDAQAQAAMSAQSLQANNPGNNNGVQSALLETSNVDLARSMVEQTVAQRGVEANVTSAQTQDQMMQTALDIKA